jgi:type IV pilus assembly protein PilB
MLNQDLYKNILVDEKYITAEDLAAAEAFEKAGKGTLLEYLEREEIIDQATLGQAIAEHYKTSFVDLESRTPSAEDVARIPAELAKKYNVVFIKEDAKEIAVATDGPDDQELAKSLKALFPSKTVKISFAFLSSISPILARYKKELNTRFSEIIKNQERVAPEIFEEIIKDALSYRASDIHFEPQPIMTLVRFRIDGMLRLAGTIPREYYESVLNRIKIQSSLRIDEHATPQDGAIRFTADNTTVDLRVSIVPTLDGEKVVIRILAEYVKGLTFGDLGLTEGHIRMLEAAAAKPFGMIIVSGPTGSGKTTTLYSLIKKLNVPQVNITTIEDPVEYRMIGANQIQVNPKTSLSFAKGLRAIVRQDPNIILVGEIRDAETVETAINAALTGHLLLSTFHANDAATSIPRLLEMGVEPFLLSSTLELIVAQRLVRKICESCRYSSVHKVSSLKGSFPEATSYFGGSEVTLYKGKGCNVCAHTGYKGRTSILEMIQVDQAMKDCINGRPSASTVQALARKSGAKSLFEDGLEKVKLGITTLEEVLRVAPPVSSK